MEALRPCHSSPTILEFDSVEQLDQLPRDLGWPLEYRQIEAGPFLSRWSVFEDESCFLLEEQSMRNVEISAGAAEGMAVFAVVDRGVVVNGQRMGTQDVFLQTPGAELVAMLPAGVCETQMAIPIERLEAMIEVIAPGLPVRRGEIRIFPADPMRVDAARQAMRDAIRAPSPRAAIRDENIAAIAASLIAAAGADDRSAQDQGLNRLATQRVMERARNYIEAHTDQAIRIESLCDYAGTTLRTLERMFTREIGVTPQKYVRARRLNAARRCLLDANRKQGIRVTDVAIDNGFNHLGRFAGEYRRFFGESPKETLLSH